MRTDAPVRASDQAMLIDVFTQLFLLAHVFPGGQLVLRGPHFAAAARRSSTASYESPITDEGS
jgi:hypothetical protein